jgi:hypothetical protein
VCVGWIDGNYVSVKDDVDDVWQEQEHADGNVFFENATTGESLPERPNMERTWGDVDKIDVKKTKRKTLTKETSKTIDGDVNVAIPSHNPEEDEDVESKVPPNLYYIEDPAAASI